MNVMARLYIGKNSNIYIIYYTQKKLSNILVNEIGIIKDRLSDYKTVL